MPWVLVVNQEHFTHCLWGRATEVLRKLTCQGKVEHIMLLRAVNTCVQQNLRLICASTYTDSAESSLFTFQKNAGNIELFSVLKIYFILLASLSFGVLMKHLKIR